MFTMGKQRCFEIVLSVRANLSTGTVSTDYDDIEANARLYEQSNPAIEAMWTEFYESAKRTAATSNEYVLRRTGTVL